MLLEILYSILIKKGEVQSTFEIVLEMLWKLRLHRKTIHIWEIINSYKSSVLSFGTVKHHTGVHNPPFPIQVHKCTVYFCCKSSAEYTWDKQLPSGKQFRETVLRICIW